MKKVFENPYTIIYDISDEIPHTMLVYWVGFFQKNDEEAM